VIPLQTIEEVLPRRKLLSGTAAARALLVKPMRMRATMVMNFMMGEVRGRIIGSVGVGTEEMFTLELNLIYVHSSVDNDEAKNTSQTEINENTLCGLNAWLLYP
jgi:hypothetical protein